MNKRAHALADRFMGINNEIIATIEACSATQWQATCPGESWPVAVTLHHIAMGHTIIIDIVESIVTGEPIVPHTLAIINLGDAGNAQHAQEYALCSKDDVLELLHSDGARAAAYVRRLTDEQLDRAIPLFGQPSVSAIFAVEDYLIGHMERHFRSVQQAIAIHSPDRSDAVDTHPLVEAPDAI